MNVVTLSGTFQISMDRDGHALQTSAIDVAVVLAPSVECLENEWVLAVG